MEEEEWIHLSIRKVRSRMQMSYEVSWRIWRRSRSFRVRMMARWRICLKSSWVDKKITKKIINSTQMEVQVNFWLKLKTWHLLTAMLTTEPPCRMSKASSLSLTKTPQIKVLTSSLKWTITNESQLSLSSCVKTSKTTRSIEKQSQGNTRDLKVKINNLNLRPCASPDHRKLRRNPSQFSNSKTCMGTSKDASKTQKSFLETSFFSRTSSLLPSKPRSKHVREKCPRQHWSTIPSLKFLDKEHLEKYFLAFTNSVEEKWL